MNRIVTILLLLVLVAILITALVFATSSAKSITNINPKAAKNAWRSNSNLKDAHSMLTWLAVGGWITVVLIGFGLVVFLFTGGKEKIAGHTNPIFILLLVTVTGMILVIGVLSILASENLKKATSNATAPVAADAPNYVKARKDAVLAASLAIGSLGLIVLLWIIFIAARHSSKTSKEKAQEAKVEEEVTGVSAEEREAEKKEKLEEIKEEKKEAQEDRTERAIRRQAEEIKAVNEARAETDALNEGLAPTKSEAVIPSRPPESQGLERVVRSDGSVEYKVPRGPIRRAPIRMVTDKPAGPPGNELNAPTSTSGLRNRPKFESTYKGAEARPPKPGSDGPSEPSLD